METSERQVNPISIHSLLSDIVFVEADGSARLSDFGLSSIMRGPESTEPGGGTLRWAAPELFEVGTVNTKESDIYAFGVLAWEVGACNDISIAYVVDQSQVFAGAAPFADSPPTAVAVQVLSGKRPERPIHASLTDGLRGYDPALLETRTPGAPPSPGSGSRFAIRSSRPARSFRYTWNRCGGRRSFEERPPKRAAAHWPRVLFHHEKLPSNSIQ